MQLVYWLFFRSQICRIQFLSMRGNELSSEICAQVCALSAAGNTQRSISSQLKISLGAMSNTLQRNTELVVYQSRKCSGGSRAPSIQTDRLIRCYVVSNPRTLPTEVIANLPSKNK